jgi:small-conductance mechanosensitive channel
VERNFAKAWDWFISGAWMPSGGRLFAALAIIGIAVLATWLLRAWLSRVRKHAGRGAPMVYIVEKVGGYLIILIGFLAGLSTLGLNLQSFSLFAGAAGVGLGLGLQGVVKEFASGLVLIFDPSVKVGDFIELDSQIRGEIVEIGARATRLRTNDNLHIVVPNSTIVQSRVTNWTLNDQTRRIHVPFSVAETADKAIVRDVVLKAAKALPFTQPDYNGRKTQVWMTGFAGDGLNFELIVWPSLESSRHPASMHAAYTWAIHDALVTAGIDNSTPQMDVRLHRLFGREGEEALRTLQLGNGHHHDQRAPPTPVPNDAVVAVYDDAVRDAKARAAEQNAKAAKAEAKADGNPV